MLGTKKVLLDREHALKHAEMNQMACRIIVNAISGRNASTLFARKRIKVDSCLVCSALIIECDTTGQRLPEVQRIRVELAHLRLNTRTNSQLHSNKFKEHVKRLKCLNESNLDDACIE